MEPNTKRWYIAGPMNGIAEHNFPAFHAAAADLRSLGITVVSPAELDEEGDSPEQRQKTWAEYMIRDLHIVLDVDGVIVLPGWERSKGATTEVLVAVLMGKEVVRYDDFKQLRPTPEDALRAAHAAWYPGSAATQHVELAAAPVAQAGGEETVLEEANRLIYGDRQASYSHPLDNFTFIGQLWGALLMDQLTRNGVYLVDEDGDDFETLSIDAESVGMMMALLKIARESANHKRDNIVDAAGYMGTVAMVHEERARRAQED